MFGRAFRTRALWAVVGHFERLVSGDVLRIAGQRAERPESGVVASKRLVHRATLAAKWRCSSLA
jgi:hypothetical protein